MNMTNSEEFIPSSIEEWIEIHGEPNYIDSESTASDELNISVKDCPMIPYEEQEGHIGLDRCIYETKSGKKQINYPNFTTALASTFNIIYNHGLFYTPDGVLPESTLRKEIVSCLEAADYTERLDIPTNAIVNTIADKTGCEEFSAKVDVIPFKNGDLHIKDNVWEFRRGEKLHSPYRLNVDFIEKDLPMPWFSKWVNDLFDKDDIVTIQEMIGYCLVPTNAAQEAFILVSNGGAGKSVLTHLMQSIFGNAFISPEIKELAEGRFALQMAENKLVVYDDDLKTEALSETGVLKKLITATQPIKAERKYKDPFEFLPYCTVIANGNDMLRTLYDDSDGFYRRLHPIKLKDKSPNRRDIANMDKLVADEKDAIVRWALKGLLRVKNNNWKIHWSEKSIQYMTEERNKGVHFEQFFEDVIENDTDSSVTSKQLYDVYKTWARANDVQAVSSRRLHGWLGENCEKLNLTKTRIGGRRVNGYMNSKIKSEWTQSIIF